MVDMTKIKQYIQSKVSDPWHGTDWEGYKALHPSNKGTAGEVYTTAYLEALNYKVEKRTNAGHDIIVNGEKVEVKFSLAQTHPKTGAIQQNCFALNHAAVGKDWDYLIFAGINHPNTPVMRKMTKENFVKCLDETTFFSKQQGGKTSDNDDWMSLGNSLQRLLESDYMEDINPWE